MKIFIIFFHNGSPWLPRYRVFLLKNGLTAGNDFSITNPLSAVFDIGNFDKRNKFNW